MMVEGIVRRGKLVVHCPLWMLADGTFVNLITGVKEHPLSYAPMSSQRQLLFKYELRKK